MAIRLSIFAFVLFLSACTQDQTILNGELDNKLDYLISKASPTGSLNFYILPQEDDYQNIPQDPKNPLTKEKVELGKFLYFETGLAQDALLESNLGTYSCSSCHVAEAGFKPGNFQGIADGGAGFGINGENRLKDKEYSEADMDVQSARPLTMVNVAYVKNTFWNGQFGSTGVNIGTEDVWDLDEATERNHQGFEGIETQNFEGLISHRISINEALIDSLGYKDMFDEAFSDFDISERYTIRTASFAFSAFIRTILATKAPFQDYLKGNKSALSFEEKNGAKLFFGKALCSTCHYNPNLGSLEFHALGVKDMYQRQFGAYNASSSDERNLGRASFTRNEEDNFKFKVPGLYNTEQTPFLFHGASATSLEDVINYKNLAQSENPNVSQDLISDKFQALALTEEEKSSLIQFLRSGLHDPDLVRYKPDFILSGNCYPNNDPQSQIDIGCN